MPYTLTMFFAWGVTMSIVGIVIGWLLRTARSRRQVADATVGMVDEAEVDRLQQRLDDLDGVVAERDRLRMEVADLRGKESEDVPPNIREARLVLGPSVELDDLTVIEGIDARTAELCRTSIGVATWRALSITEVGVLRLLLADAGEPFDSLDPSSWPQQAALLAGGRWHDFARLTAAMRDAW